MYYLAHAYIDRNSPVDKSRIAKSLRTSHAAGPRPTLQTFASEGAEAEFIALEIKRLIAHSGGILGWNDFVVLCVLCPLYAFYSFLTTS